MENTTSNRYGQYGLLIIVSSYEKADSSNESISIAPYYLFMVWRKPVQAFYRVRSV